MCCQPGLSPGDLPPDTMPGVFPESPPTCPPANLSRLKDLQGDVPGVPIPAAASGHPTGSCLSASPLLWVTPQQAELLREGPASPTLPDTVPPEPCGAGPEQGLRAVSLKLGCTLESPENLQQHSHAQDVTHANEIVISGKRSGKSSVKVLVTQSCLTL